MSHILKIEPISLGVVALNDGTWVASAPEYVWKKTPEQIRERDSLGVAYISAAYQVTATPVVQVVVVSSPVESCVSSDLGDAGISHSRAMFACYVTDVTPDEYEAAIKKAAANNDRIVDITRAGLADMRSKTHERLPHP